MKRKPLHLTAHLATITAALESRTIAGIITIFDVPASDGRVFHAGCITARDPLQRVKLLIDHDKSQPVGYMTTLETTATQASATFYVPEGEAGDKALADAAAGLRDGLSVGLLAAADGYDFDADGNLHIYQAELYETSLVSVPAFQDAQVTDVAAALADSRNGDNPMNRKQIDAALAAGTITQAQADAMIAGLAAIEASVRPGTPAAPAAVVAPVEVTAGPETVTPGQPRVEVTARPKDLRTVTAEVSAAIAGGQTREILAALQDVLPADDAGQGFIGRADWIGELWTATKTDRPWIDSFGIPKQLTAAKIKGYRWVTRPKPAKYAGNKTDVASNKPTTEPVEATPTRWAGGWDIDRIFIDLGDPQFLADFWKAATLEYQTDSDFDVAQQIALAATEPVDDLDVAIVDATVLAAIKGAATSLRKIGATIDNIWLAEDLFDAYSDLKIADLPAWLANAIGGVSLRDGTAIVGDLKIAADSALEDGTLVAYDKRAATVSERSPFQVQALDVAKGGIDLGFFSYGGVIVNDPRAIVKRTVA